jgi:NAD(P)-dependent dehydrogenase (short-subunit alcohol dehydrogenase family)
MFDFTDQVVMISGASGNVGRAAAQKFRAAGAKLALIDRHKDVLHEIFPDFVDDERCFMAGCADITDLVEVSKVVDMSLEHFGRIDVLANTVGGYRAGTPIHDTPIATWDFMMNLNARTVFIITQSVAPQMIAQGRGKIIHLAARPGQQGRADMGAYSASKAAVIRLTESAAAELKGHGINVNCLLPGTLDTPQNREAVPDADFSRWVSTASLAGVILFLASDVARDIHGAAIPVTGLTA